MKKILDTATIADPVHKFDPKTETTFYLLKEMCGRGHVNWIMEMKDLHAEGSTIWGRARRVHVDYKGGLFSYKFGEEKDVNLGEMDVLFLRKDPPVDMEFMQYLALLELLEKISAKSPLFVNSPSGIRKAGEKIYPLHFPGISPESVISADRGVCLAFVDKHKSAVLKPLDKGGGRGVFLVCRDDPNHMSILESATNCFSKYVMLQKYIPEAEKGDKRIMLLEGEPLGGFLRVSSESDFRCNLHSGGRCVKSAITPDEEKILARIRPQLIADGLHFVGIDFIGSCVTEINSTSPMGLGEINRLEGIKTEKTVIDWVENNLLNC